MDCVGDYLHIINVYRIIIRRTAGGLTRPDSLTHFCNRDRRRAMRGAWPHPYFIDQSGRTI